MAYKLGDITTRVQTRIADTGFPTSTIHGFINDTVNDIYNEYRLPFMEDSTTFTSVGGSSDITGGSGLPSNFVQVIDITVQSPAFWKLLPYWKTTDVDATYPDPDNNTINPSGPPTKWYEFARSIRVYPVPDKAYQFLLRYLKKPTELVGDDDVPELPSEFEELLIVGAAYRIMQVKDNYDQAAILQNKYDEILLKLVVKYSESQVGFPNTIGINRQHIGKRSF